VAGEPAKSALLAILDPTQPYTALFEAFTDEEFIPVYSRPTFDELSRMLTTSHNVAHHYRINAADANAFVESIFYDTGEYVEISGTLHVSSDVNDDMFVETAIFARGHVLVAKNRDLHEPAVRRLLHGNGISVSIRSSSASCWRSGALSRRRRVPRECLVGSRSSRGN